MEITKKDLKSLEDRKFPNNEILKITKHNIEIKNFDILDKTPILYIKPYVNEFDCRKSLKHGWIEGNIRKMTR